MRKRCIAQPVPLWRGLGGGCIKHTFPVETMIKSIKDILGKLLEKEQEKIALLEQLLKKGEE